MIFDAHNHLQDEWLAPHLDRIAAELAAAGIAGMVVNGTCESDWPAVSALAARFPWVRPSFGLHPWQVGNASRDWRDRLQRLLDAHPEAAVGEIGLDRWILDRARPDDSRLAGLRRAPLAEQGEAFRWQLRLAAERNRPASIHCLDAWGALAESLAGTPLPADGFLLHAYSGSVELISPFSARGAFFSFNGSFLPPRASASDVPAKANGESRARRYAEVFLRVPLDRLLVETDAPAMPLPPGHASHGLPPLPNGTTLNHPANIAAVYAGLAEIRSLPLAELIPTVAANFHRLFRRAPG